MDILITGAGRGFGYVTAGTPSGKRKHEEFYKLVRESLGIDG